jgi:hypothetical protein
VGSSGERMILAVKLRRKIPTRKNTGRKNIREVFESPLNVAPWIN